MNDLQIARIARALRHRLHWRQVDTAERAGLGHDVVSRVELGRLAGLTVGTLQRLFGAYDAEVVIVIRWRGGELDRLVDRRHADLGGRCVSVLERLGWIVMPEVSYSEYGERGSIDLLAWHAASRILLAIEIKTELTSVEETIRRHDAKARLAARIAKQRFGWEPDQTARLLVLPDERTPRRHVERYASVLDRAYPARGRVVRTWLAKPLEFLSGLMFLSSADGPRARQRDGPVRRVTRQPQGAKGAESPSPSRVIGG